MPTIQLRELQPAGSELFQDDESFLNELSEKEPLLQGGEVTTVSLDAVQETMNINNQQQTMNVAITFVPIDINVDSANINVENISGAI